MGIGQDLVGDLEQRMVAGVLQRRELFRMTGEASQCHRAERELESTYPGMHCLLLPSASIGLALILETLDLEAGGEVLIAPFGWLSNWSCIRRAGLVPVFLPLDDRLQLDADAVAKRINSKTAAVVVTHMMGRGQQAVGRIAEICQSSGIPLLEDVAQSFGVSIDGKRAGTFGAAAWCSLNQHKILSTGDGGFVAVKDPEHFSRVSALHDQGCVMVAGKRRPADPVEPGLSLRANELTAAVLRAQLARFHGIRARILDLHDRIGEACETELGLSVLSPAPGDLPFTVLFRRPVGLRYPSLARSGWHVADNVPWLAGDICSSSEDTDRRVTTSNLSAVSALGAGFIDPYYAIDLGIRITDRAARVAPLIRALEELS